MLHLLADALVATNHLNRIFQSRDISFHSIKGQIQSILDTLQEYQNDDGPFLESFKQATAERDFFYVDLHTQAERGQEGQKAQFQAAKTRFLNEVMQNIRARFPQMDILNAMQIFEPAAYPANGQPLNFWGTEHLETLLAHYGQQKETVNGVHEPIVDADLARGEFLMFKRLVDQNREYHHYRAEELFSRIFGGANMPNRRIFKEMYKLMLASLVIMPSNAEAERSFSVQNRIKTRLRNQLSIETLDQLIRLSCHKIPLTEFKFDLALSHYMVSPHRW